MRFFCPHVFFLSWPRRFSVLSCLVRQYGLLGRQEHTSVWPARAAGAYVIHNVVLRHFNLDFRGSASREREGQDPGPAFSRLRVLPGQSRKRGAGQSQKGGPRSWGPAFSRHHREYRSYTMSSSNISICSSGVHISTVCFDAIYFYLNHLLFFPCTIFFCLK